LSLHDALPICLQDQVLAAVRLHQAALAWRLSAPDLRAWRAVPRGLVMLAALVALLAVLLASRRRGAADARAALPTFYARALRTLARRGLRPGDGARVRAAGRGRGPPVRRAARAAHDSVRAGPLRDPPPHDGGSHNHRTIGLGTTEPGRAFLRPPTICRGLAAPAPVNGHPRPGDRPRGQAPAGRADRRDARPRPRRSRALRHLQGQGSLEGDRAVSRAARWRARARDGDDADAGGRGEVDDR